MSKRHLVIVNPASGSGRTASRWQKIVDSLKAKGVDGNVKLTEHAGHATTIAREFAMGGAGQITLLGGDGTVGETVAGLLDEATGELIDGNIHLAVIHQGTGGDFARGLGIPKTVEGAVDVAANGLPTLCDMGVARLTGTPPNAETITRGWINCCNVGLGADVVEKVTGRLKKLGDAAAFGVASVGCILGNRSRMVTVQLDDEDLGSVAITEVMVANNTHAGGGMNVAPAADISDGLLDVLIIGAAGRFRLVRTFPKIYKGTHVSDSLARVATAKKIRIDSQDGYPPERVVLDGELVGQTPAEFEVVPHALHVLRPMEGSKP